MSSPAFLAITAELEAIRTKYTPVLEGWRDWRRLNLSSPGQDAADRNIAFYAQFLEAIGHMLASAEPVAALGYPNPPPAVLDPAIVAEMQENKATLQAALNTVQTGPGEAVTGTIGLGNPIPADG